MIRQATFIQRLCPVCDSASYSQHLQKINLTLMRCNDCSMVFANPVSEEMATGEFYDQLATPFYLSPEKLDNDYSPVRFERELKLFRRYCQSGRVLDVGCSTGAFLFHLQNRFARDYKVLGIDVSGPALAYAERKGVPVSKESFLKTKFESFASITFWAVLEHLVNPRDFLRKAASLIEPGGHCFILVPNYGSLATRILRAKYRYILPQHVNYFTAETLNRFVSAEPRFKVVSCGSTHLNPLVIWQDFRGSGSFVPDAERARLLKRTTAYKQNPALRPVKLGLRAIEAMLGKWRLADNLAMVLERT